MSTLLEEPARAVRRGSRQVSTADVWALSVPVGIALALGLRPFAEPDLWWHLRVGEHIRQTGQLVGPDPWAAFADRDYMATQWLPEALTAYAFSLTGLSAILFFRSATIVLLALLIFTLCRQVAAPAVSAFITVMALLATTAALNPRPQLLSFIFFALTVTAWRQTAHDHRPRWWLVPMFWLWACCHGLWLFGLATGVATVLALVIDRRILIGTQAVRRLFLLNALCALSIALTPLGPRLWLAPFQVAGNASWVADEWQRTPFDIPASMVAAAMVVTTAILYARRGFAPLWEYLHLAMAAVLLVWMWRLVPLAVILVAPLLASGLQCRLSRSRERERAADHRLGRLLVLGLAVLGAGVVSAGPRGDSASLYPSDLTAVDALLDCQPRDAVVFNDFGLSGWLLWRHPELVPVADLRAEIYPRTHLENYYIAEGVAPGWESVVRDSGATLALLQTDDPLAQALIGESGWQVAASSPGGVLLSSPGASVRRVGCDA